MRPALLFIVACPLLCLGGTSMGNFEGTIETTLTRGIHTENCTYSVASITLLFPHNRSFIRLPAADESTTPDRVPGMPVPLNIGPEPVAAAATHRPPAPTPLGHIGPTNLLCMPEMPAILAGMGAGVSGAMPVIPMVPLPDERLKLKATADTANFLGYICARYELKQRGEIMEIWSTYLLLPFHAWLPNQPSRSGLRILKECWGKLLQAKKLFPLLVSLKSGNCSNRLRFEVKSIMPERIEHTLHRPGGKK